MTNRSDIETGSDSPASCSCHRWLAAFVLLALTVVKPAFAHFKCDASTYDDWLEPTPKAQEGTKVDALLVRPVVSNLSQALSMLQKRNIASLTPDDVKMFLGSKAMPLIPDNRLRPYLVRAVFPTSYPSLEIQLKGDDLYVFAGGLGCVAFSKHPIIVFLDHQPAHVFVRASAAL